MTRFEAQEIIRKAALECIAKAKLMYPQFTRAPRILFTKRGRSRLGEANYDDNTVNFNLDYAVLDIEAFMPTVPHEVAHIVSVAVYGRKDGGGHGLRWRSVDRALGGNGARCGGDEIDSKAVAKGRQTNEYLYVNSLGREVWIGPVHHGRLQRKGGSPDNLYAYALINRRTGAKTCKTGFQYKMRQRA